MVKCVKLKNIKNNSGLHEENRGKYSHFTSEVFDQTPDEELTHAVLFHLLAKEDKLYEGEEITGTLIDVMTPSELLIYTIYQVELSMEGAFIVHMPLKHLRLWIAMKLLS